MVRGCHSVGRPRLRIVGVGPGSPNYLTDAARTAILESSIVVGWDLDLAPIRHLLGGKQVFVQNASNYREVARRAAAAALREVKDVAVARIGDPCVSSGLHGLLDVFSEFNVEIVPGVSSIQVAAALSAINLDDSAVLSFHDYGDHNLERKFMVDAFNSGRHLIVLTGSDLTAEGVCAALIEAGCEHSTAATVYSNLTLEGESVFAGTVGEVAAGRFDWLSVVVVLNPSGAGSTQAHSVWSRRRSKGQIEL